MTKLTDDELYEMTRGFLSESYSELGQRRRPKLIDEALKNLQEVAPTHAQVIERYIRALENHD